MKYWMKRKLGNPSPSAKFGKTSAPRVPTKPQKYEISYNFCSRLINIIEIKKTNNNLFINIEDNGPGIPKNEFENVFKPFYKIDKGRAETKSSVGLGLSIASDIIRSHGGNIKLENSSLGGLGVRIFLPF